jgi:hypothetical protein
MQLNKAVAGQIPFSPRPSRIRKSSEAEADLSSSQTAIDLSRISPFSYLFPGRETPQIT